MRPTLFTLRMLHATLRTLLFPFCVRMHPPICFVSCLWYCFGPHRVWGPFCVWSRFQNLVNSLRKGRALPSVRVTSDQPSLSTHHAASADAVSRLSPSGDTESE